MSWLGEVLELGDHARLTGIGLDDLAATLHETDGSVLVDVLILPEPFDNDSAGSALGRFLPAQLAGVGGRLGNGQPWCASFQFTRETETWPSDIASAAVDRAMELVGVDAESHYCLAMDGPVMRAVYAAEGAGPVESWSVAELLVGLLLDLANFDLDEVTEQCRQDDGRQAALRSFLTRWTEQR